MRTELQMAEPCSGCGRCCEKIGMPPFEVRNPLLPPDPPYRSVSRYTCEHAWVNDLDIFASMPPALLREHADLVLALDADPTGRPCPWLDSKTRGCRHYEHRPTTCRAWPVLGHGCRAALDGATVAMWDAWDSDPHRWRNPLRARTHPDNPWYKRLTGLGTAIEMPTTESVEAEAACS